MTTIVKRIFGIQPNQFQYTLIIGPNEYILPHAPIGWDDSIIKWSRSDTYYGMIRTFSVPLKFVLDGAWLLRKEFYTYGIEAKVQVKIESLNNSTWIYKQIYLGDIDFSTFKDSEYEVEVNMMEGGISKQVKAYENVKYEIDIDVPEAVDILITGVNLIETAGFIFPPNKVVLPPSPGNLKYFPEISLEFNEKKSTQTSVQSVDEANILNPDFTVIDAWFFKANTDSDVKISGNIKGKLISQLFDQAVTVTFDFRNSLSSGGPIVQTILSHVIPGGGTEYEYEYDVSFDFTVPVVSGEKLFFCATKSFASVAVGIEVYSGELRASYSTVSPPSPCKALRPRYVFDKLIEKMNGSPYPTQSFLLKEWEQLCITSGDAIRGIQEPKMKISFKDFFNAINSVLNAGFGIENNKAILERKDYFFKPNLQAVNVGEIKDFLLETYENFIYSSIKAGYPDKTYDELNGREEVNSTQIYTTPITRIQKEFNLLSTIRADIYGIEFLRTSLKDSDSTDNEADNDLFFIKIKPNPEPGEVYYLPERSEAYLSIDGLSAEDSAYNLDITPKKNLLRHANFLHGMLDKLDGYQIKFASADKNVDLTTVDLNGKVVSERANVEISTLGDKLFLPYLATITTKLPKNTLELMDNFPTGYVKFTYNGDEYTGFMMDVSVDVSKNSQREFKLLLTPLNNLAKLIH